MRDQEFIELRNKFLIAMFIIFLIGILGYTFLKNKLYIKDPEVLEALNNKESIVVLVTKENCDRCKKTQEVLNEVDVNYYILNSERERSYETILKKMNLFERDIDEPTLIYIEEGNVIATLPNIRNQKQITDFVDSYKLNR